MIATAQLMVTLDRTIVNIALPSIQHSLHFSVTGLSWVVDAYVLAFGGLLLLGGRAGDLFGRRRVLEIGIAVFTLASLLGGLTPSSGWLVAACIFQGLGAAVAAPTALSLIVTTFPEGPARHRAMAVYAGMSGAGASLGLLFGGILVQLASWRWVFLVNVPIGVAILVLAPISLPMGDRTRRRLDLPGAVLITASMTTLVYGLERAPSSGWWSSSTITWLVVAISLLALFVIVELRTVAPLVPLGFLRHRSRAAGYVMMLALGGAMLAVLYFLTQFLQESLHYSALMAGVAYLPVPVTVGGMGVLVSRVVGRTGVRPFLTVGPLLVTGGMIWLSTLTAHSTYLVVFWPLVLIGLGQGCSFVPLTLNAVAVCGREPSRTGFWAAQHKPATGLFCGPRCHCQCSCDCDQALCRRSRDSRRSYWSLGPDGRRCARVPRFDVRRGHRRAGCFPGVVDAATHRATSPHGPGVGRDCRGDRRVPVTRRTLLVLLGFL